MKYLDLAIANEQIKTTDIKGKDYAEVNQRIKVFRMLYPNGTIKTEMISNENGVCIFRAEILDNEGYLLATGTAYEKENSTFINKTSYIENCETSAVGRALGMCGIGIDTSVASAEEVQNAIQNQEVTKEEADNYTLEFGKHKGKKINELPNDYIDWLLDNSKDEKLLKIIELTTGKKLPSEEEQQEMNKLIIDNSNMMFEQGTDREEMMKYFKVESDRDMTLEQLKELNKILKGRKK